MATHQIFPVLHREKWHKPIEKIADTVKIDYWRCNVCGYRLSHAAYMFSRMDYGCPRCGNSYAYFTSVAEKEVS